MRVISLTGATGVPDPDTGKPYEPGADGVFELPEPFGLYLTTKHASVWRGEAAHQAAQRAALVEELRNPNVLSTVVADLRFQVEQLTAQVAEHEAKLAAKPARSGKGTVKASDPVEPVQAEQAPDSPPAEDGATTEGDTAPSDGTPDPVDDSTDKPAAEAKPTQARKTAAKKTAAPKPPAE